LGNGAYTVTAGAGSGIENSVTATLNCVTVTPDPTEEVTPEVTVTPDPTQEVTPDPTQEVTPDPTQEVTPDPTQEVTPDPTQEVTPDPTQEVTPDPTDDPTPEVTDQPTGEPTPEATDDPGTPGTPERGTQAPPPADPSYGCKFTAVAQYWYFVPVGESWAWGGIPYQLSTIPTEIWIGGEGHHPNADFEVYVYSGSGDIHDPASYQFVATFTFVADRDCARVEPLQPTPRPIPPSGSSELPGGTNGGNPLPVVGFAVLVISGTVLFYRRRARRAQG